MSTAIRGFGCALAALLTYGSTIIKGADGAPEKPAARGGTFLILDYLPEVLCEGDAITVCFRAENAGTAAADFELRCTTSGANGTQLKTLTKKLACAPGAFAPATMELDSRDAAFVAAELYSGGTLAGTFSAFLQYENAPWPETRISQGRLILAPNGAVVVPLVKKKRAVEERAFAPLDWMLGRSAANSSAGGGAILAFAPAKWELQLKGVAPLGPYAAGGGTPILRATDAILSALRTRPGEKFARAAIVLPPEDLELATDARTYHLVLNALLARLEKAGVAQTVLIAPFKFGCNDSHRAALWKELRASAVLYGARVQEPTDWMGESAWLADPRTPGVTAPAPNAAGRKMIEQALSDLIK